MPTTPPSGTVTIYFQNQRCESKVITPTTPTGPQASCTISNVLAGEAWNLVIVYSGDDNWSDSVLSSLITVQPQPSTSPPAPQPAPGPLPVYPPAPQVIVPPPTSNVIVTVIVNNNVATSGGNSGATTTTGSGGQQVTVDSTLARFDAPTGIARDKQGNLYVSDRNNFTIRKIAPNGAVTTLAGLAGQKGTADGAGSAARFTAPGALAVDNVGNLFVLDGRNLRKLALATGTVSTVVRTPETAGATSNNFLLPDGVAADTNGNVFVSDYLLGAVWKVDSSGQVTRFAKLSAGITDPNGSGPSAIATDAMNNLYVTDLPYSPNAGGASSIRKIDANGTVTTVVEASAGLVNAHGLAVDASGDFFVNENSLIVRVNADRRIVSYKLPASPAGGNVLAAGITVDPTGENLYFTDSGKSTVDLLQSNGTIQIIAGKAGETGSADATP